MDGFKSTKAGASTNFASFVEDVRANKVKYGSWHHYSIKHKWHSTLGSTMRAYSQGDVLISTSNQVQWD